MTTKNDYEKEQAKLEAENRTQFELRRIHSYRKLRYDYIPDNSSAYYNSIFERRYQKYKPKRDANRRDARKSLQIGLVTNIKAQFNPDEKKIIDKKLKAEIMRLQEQVNKDNQRENERCNRVNSRLNAQINNKKQALAEGDMDQVKGYFSAVLQNDEYSLDCEYSYEIDFSLGYTRPLKRLVIDYRLPAPDEISDTKEWKVSKNNELVKKPFPKGEFLVLYEKIILDLVIRVIGLAFDSDDQQILSEIVFNGSCIYDNAPDDVIFIISLLVAKKEFDTSTIRRADFSSKAAITKFSQVEYLGDISAVIPPKALTDNPTLNGIAPIQSNLYSQ